LRRDVLRRFGWQTRRVVVKRAKNIIGESSGGILVADYSRFTAAGSRRYYLFVL